LKIVFLDFDGVLNSHRFFLEERARGVKDVTSHLDRAAVARLNLLCQRGEASVVISSSWRIGRTLSQLKDVLGEAGFTGTVIDATPAYGYTNSASSMQAEAKSIVLAYGRGLEIDGWLASSSHDVTAFVALDDDSDMAPHTDRHVKTSFDEGLLDWHVDRALQVLLRPWAARR
jgi:hypothetical protein